MKNSETFDAYSVRPKCLDIDLTPRVLPPVQHKPIRLRVLDIRDKKKDRNAHLSMGCDEIVLDKQMCDKTEMTKTG